MASRNFSLFAALLFALPASAKQVANSSEPTDLDTRLARAKSILEKLDAPTNRGGVTRDEADPNKVSWDNWDNWRNWKNWQNFRNTPQ
ncbi:MAG: hypothetical protein V7608_5222 [Hyphomicrobiales bacterium]